MAKFKESCWFSVPGKETVTSLVERPFPHTSLTNHTLILMKNEYSWMLTHNSFEEEMKTKVAKQMYTWNLERCLLI